MTSPELVDAVRGIPMQDCRECATPIRFVALDTGRLMPVDPLPYKANDKRANVCARVIGGQLRGYVVSKADPYQSRFHRFMPHFATCEARNTPKPASPDDPALF